MEEEDCWRVLFLDVLTRSLRGAMLLSKVVERKNELK